MVRAREGFVNKFMGLSDRSVPGQLQRAENPDLRNVEFSGRVMERRNGFRRVHTNRLRDACVSLDGVNDYLEFDHKAAFQWNNRGFIAIDCKVTRIPDADAFLVSKGDGTGAARFFAVSYDPTAGTGSAGAWVCRVYDATAAALRTATIDDAAATIEGQCRHIEFVHSTGNDYTFRIRDEAGAAVGSDQTVIVQTWVTNTLPWLIGCSDDGASSVGEFLACDVNEFRLADHTAAPNCAGIVGRELDRSGESTELDNMVGYWRLSDGRGSTFANDIAAGDGQAAVAVGEPPQWVTDASLCVGTSGLEFFGHPGGVFFNTTFNDYLWRNTQTASLAWGIDVHFVPRMDPGETTVRPQTLMWTGNNATNPAPLGIEVGSGGNSDKIVVTFRDSTGTNATAVVNVALSGLVNKRCMIWVAYWEGATSADTIYVRVEAETNPLQPGVYKSQGGGATLVAGTDFTAGGAVPFSLGWSFGQKLLTIPTPTVAGGPLVSFRTTDHARCIISTARIWKALPRAGVGVTSVPLWSTIAEYTASPVAHVVLVAQLRMNDGTGRNVEVTGARVGTPSATNPYATIYPGPEDGVRFGEGLVEPYEPPPVYRLGNFRRVTIPGTSENLLAVMSGCSIYAIDTAAQKARVIATNIPKPIRGGVSADQYGDRFFFAMKNGQRPKELTANGAINVGIEAPNEAPAFTVSAAGGTIPDGTHTLFVTYRNDSTGQESNPSYAASVTTTGGGTSQITAVQLPVSSDPQVTQRRIWLSPSGGGSTYYLAATVEDNAQANWTVGITALPAITQATLVLADNQEAPLASVVKVFKDRLCVAGNPTFPTRVWYSGIGTLSAFNQELDYVDADLDSGDPVVALWPLGDQLIVYLRDGKQAMTPSQDAATPFFLSRITDDRGGVAHNAIEVLDAFHIVFGERDVYIFNGVQSQSISSPRGDESPSIETTIRTEVDPECRDSVHIAHYRNRNQIWMSYCSRGVTRNDRILVFDQNQGIWSKYDLPLDFLMEVEDALDDPALFGAAQGFVVQLDIGDFDGHAQAAAATGGAVTSGTTWSLTDVGKSWVVDAYKGLTVYWYDASAGVLRSSRIRKNTATTLSFYAEAAAAPDVGDGFIIGGIPWYADWYFDFGTARKQRRLKWMTLVGTSNNDANVLKISVESDQIGRAWTGSGATHYERTWASNSVYELVGLGGLGRSFRVRIHDTGFPGAATADPIPSVTGRMAIHEFALEVEELDTK